MNQRHISQKGSVAAFIVVGAVLAFLVVGGMYALKHRTETAGSQPIAVIKNGSSDKKASSSAPATNDTKKDNGTTKTPGAAASSPAPTDTAKSSSAPVPVPTSTATPSQAISASGQSTSGGELPKTGPSDTILQVVAGAILVAGVIAYLQSYRHRFGSLFR